MQEHDRPVRMRPGKDFVKLLENPLGGNARDAVYPGEMVSFVSVVGTELG